MKTCPFCHQQFPNGFQYCPNDTELLVTSEEYARRLQIRTRTPTPPATEVITSTGKSGIDQHGERIIALSPQPHVGNGQAASIDQSVPSIARERLREKVDTESRMTLLPPAQDSLFKQLSEGISIFFKYLGQKPKVEANSIFIEQGSLLKRMSEGGSLFFKYLGRRTPSSSGEFLVPDSGNIIERLSESARLFIRDFGKEIPEVKSGEMGLLADESVFKRVGRELKQAGVDLRRDPRGFVISILRGDGMTKRRQRLLQGGIAVAMIAYAFIFTSFLLAGLFNFGRSETEPEEERLQVQALLTPPPIDVGVKDAPKEVPKGKGGFTGGSKPKPQQASGGGGGGRQQPNPPSQGRPPQMALSPQIIPPNPEPPKIKNPSLPVPMTAYGDPNALPQLKGPIGDPRGVPAPPSSGPGTNAGIGTGSGTGVGPGDGSGVGPGRGGNAGGGDMDLGGGRGPGGRGGIYDMGRDGVGRIVLLYKEKAKYTEEARQNKIQGTVVLSAVFTSDGRINGIRVIRGLPDGLTEKAIEAAQRIRFQPATKNGVPVTVRGQLEFTFNLY